MLSFLLLGFLLPPPLLAAPHSPSEVLSLAGSWRIQLDPERRGEAAGWFNTKLPGRIRIPGTTDQAKLGSAVEAVDQGHLVRAHRYIGPAWYQRDVVVPAGWEGRHVELLIERALWTTRVWVDGEPVAGVEDSLVAPHRHPLGLLRAGRHQLTVCVDNSLHVNIGTLSHAYTEETQSIWNGLVGRVELVARPAVSIEAVRPFLSFDRSNLRVEVTLTNRTGVPIGGMAFVRLLDADGSVLGQGSTLVNADFRAGADSAWLALSRPLPLWDEFNPRMCRIEVDLEAGGFRDQRSLDCGFREIVRDGGRLLINGQPVFLRGNIECCVFPRTGHPPMEVASWLRIFRIAQAHGFNHFRFHTWCPPEAAFVAADQVGVYLNPETPTWTDGFWPAEFTAPRMRERPKPFGADPAVVDFTRREMQRMQDAYGHHPSFCLLTIGNELGNADWALGARLIDEARTRDPRLLYAVSTARELTPSDDFFVTHATKGGAARGLGKASTDWDFSAALKGLEVPLISHETGQRPVFPDWSKLSRYRGPLTARNLEVFRDRMAARGLLGINPAFNRASEAWAFEQYRHEIEAIRRTPGYDGYQLLQLNDFTGQTEALVGLLDPFWEAKGRLTSAAWHGFQAPTVPLARFARHVWEAGETFTAELLVSHFGPQPLRGIRPAWRLSDDHGMVLGHGTLPTVDLAVGEVTALGRVEMVLPACGEPRRLTLTLQAGPASNEWRLWGYPAASAAPPTGDTVLLAERFDLSVRRALAEGRRVLLTPKGLKHAEAFRGRFFSVYWSAVMFSQPDGTLGLVCDPKHPALAGFPNDGHTDWQWRSLVEGSTVFVLDEGPRSLRPIVQQVPDFHFPRKLGSVLELRVGPGRLLVCGLNLAAADPAARALKTSLIQYAGSTAFRPTVELPAPLLERLLAPRP